MRRTFFGFLIAISLCVTPILLPAQETGKRFITDMTGRRVVITGPVKRVVSTFKPASLCVLSLGFAHTLVGVDNSSRKDPLQQAVWPDIQHLAGVGTKSMGINLETLVSLEPDLVIFYSQNDGLSATEKLTAMGIPCIVILPESFDSILEAMALIAHAMGGSQRISFVRDQMERCCRWWTTGWQTCPCPGKKPDTLLPPWDCSELPPGTCFRMKFFPGPGSEMCHPI